MDNSHDALKNADDSKFHITKLNPWKLIFRKQPIIAGDEIKVSVILTTKYKVKAKNFIISIFYYPVSFLLYIVVTPRLFPFLFPYLSSSKTFSRPIKWYIQFDILVSRTYSAASSSKEASGDKINSIFPETEPRQLHESY